MTESKTAQDIAAKARTGDVLLEENLDFAGLLLCQQVQEGLKKAGFVRPSPIQLKAIPLGRCGLDLIVQAKSGTGKTCVFTVIALEGLIENCNAVQVLVLAPTREIAMQIWEVVSSIGSSLPHLKCCTFIGGTPLAEDKLKLTKCNIAVGTPGRMKQLIENHYLKTENVRLFVLDEADKLVEDSFQEQINWIYSTLPENKQMLALSATYPEVLAQHLTAYMRNPTFVRLNSSDPALLGIRQYYTTVKYHPLSHKLFDHKTEALVELLSSVDFHQCLVFSNYQMRAQSLCEVLNSRSWPAAYISGSQEQQHRMAAMASLKQMTCRILISTDLTSRGIDAENVNLVVNLDLPPDHETYLHRIGRAGRFGSYGAAVSLVAHGKEMQELQRLESSCKTVIKPLPDPIPADLTRSSGYVSIDHLVSTSTIHTRDEDGSVYKAPKDNGVVKPVSLTTEATSMKIDSKSSTIHSHKTRLEELGPAKPPNSEREFLQSNRNSTLDKDSKPSGKDNLKSSSDGCQEDPPPLEGPKAENGSKGGEAIVDVDKLAERKPKWKRNDVWTKLSFNYSAECKASEARAKKGLEDDRSNDHRRPTGSTPSTAKSCTSPTKPPQAENTSNKMSNGTEDNICHAGEFVSSRESTGKENKLPQPSISSLRSHFRLCRNFTDVLSDYETFMTGKTSPVSNGVHHISPNVEANVQEHYNKYLKGVVNLLSEPSTKGLMSWAKKEQFKGNIAEAKPGSALDLQVKGTDNTSVGPPLTDEAGEHSSDLFSVQKPSTKLSQGSPKRAGQPQKSDSKTSPQDKHAQIRKYDRRRSPRKVNQLQQRLIASPVIVNSEGGVSESNTNSYPESESDYNKDQPSDSMLSETASSANDIKRLPPKKPQTTSSYPKSPWVPYTKDSENYDLQHDTYPGRCNESSSSSAERESDEGSQIETESEASLDSNSAYLSSGDDQYLGSEARVEGLDELVLSQYQAMQYASCYHLYHMHNYYANYYKGMCKTYAKQMNQASAYASQKNYIAKMAKWMAGKRDK